MPPTQTAGVVSPARKPRENEIDAYGVTHPGKVRKDNQDHFIISYLRKQLVLRMSSIPPEEVPVESDRLASLVMVADGVGGASRGETASRMALAGVTSYLTRSLRCYYDAAIDDEQAFHSALQEGARQCHAELQRRGEEDPDFRGMATTLTLYLGIWPKSYLLQVGDSRGYLLRDGELIQISRDQTMAQAMVDLGAMKAEEAAKTKLAHTLTSSIGGSQTDPKVTRFEMNWGHVLLLCSDGLTRHVTDDRIREVLRSMTSAKQACEVLLQEALDGGGEDNITIVVGRAVQRDQ